jgi:hypothetical protein
LFGKLQRRDHLGRCRCILEDSIRLNFWKIECGEVDCKEKKKLAYVVITKMGDLFFVNDGFFFVYRWNYNNTSESGKNLQGTESCT